MFDPYSYQPGDLIASLKKLVLWAAHETIREAGIEQQNALRVNYEETGYRHVGVGDFIARKVVVLRAVEDECATLNHVQPR
jgi:hypothetical protein